MVESPPFLNPCPLQIEIRKQPRDLRFILLPLGFGVFASLIWVESHHRSIHVLHRSRAWHTSFADRDLKMTVRSRTMPPPPPHPFRFWGFLLLWFDGCLTKLQTLVWKMWCFDLDFGLWRFLGGTIVMLFYPVIIVLGFCFTLVFTRFLQISFHAEPAWYIVLVLLRMWNVL